MFSVAKDWNPKQNQLNELLDDHKKFSQAMKLCAQMHLMLHSSLRLDSLMNSLQEDLPGQAWAFSSGKKDASIAWNIWHITRIEDIACNLLILNEKQIFNEAWSKRIKCNLSDTGNAMTGREIWEFGNSINTSALCDYRRKVGEKTQAMLIAMTAVQLKEKPGKAQIERLFSEKALSEKKEAVWLADFWAKKNIAGLLKMPITRHQVMHFNDCFKLKRIFFKIL